MDVSLMATNAKNVKVWEMYKLVDNKYKWINLKYTKLKLRHGMVVWEIWENLALNVVLLIGGLAAHQYYLIPYWINI